MKICINNASFGYSKTILLDSINLEIPTGEFTCIIGSNGSGKSTILKTLTNDLIPINGEIFLKDDYGNNTDDLQKSISYLPAGLQDPLHITVAELVNLSRFNMTNIYNWKPSKIDIWVWQRVFGTWRWLDRAPQTLLSSANTSDWT